MFQASKRMRTGIFFAFLISGMFIASLPLFGVGSESSEEALALVRQNEVKKLQQALRDRGHYRRPVDGVIGLRTRAGIRAFQNAENLPVTGHLDRRTAGKLGVEPEIVGSNYDGARESIAEERDQAGNRTTKGKPWAGIKLVKGGGRTRKTLPKIASTGADPKAARKIEQGTRAENQSPVR